MVLGFFAYMIDNDIINYDYLEMRNGDIEVINVCDNDLENITTKFIIGIDTINTLKQPYLKIKHKKLASEYIEILFYDYLCNFRTPAQIINILSLMIEENISIFEFLQSFNTNEYITIDGISNSEYNNDYILNYLNVYCAEDVNLAYTDKIKSSISYYYTTSNNNINIFTPNQLNNGDKLLIPRILVGEIYNLIIESKYNGTDDNYIYKGDLLGHILSYQNTINSFSNVKSRNKELL